MRRAWVWVVAAMMFAAIGGCAPVDGVATPTETGGSAGQVPDFPPVSEPRSVSAFFDQPCSVLTESEAAGFGAANGSESIQERSAACTYHFDDDGADRLSVILVDEEVLRSTYDPDLSPDKLSLIDVTGYPALRLAVRSECQITVAVAENAGFVIIYAPGRNGPDSHDAICAKAVKGAEAILDRLPPA